MALNESLDLVFAALSDSTRRAMIERLSAGACSVSELGQPFDVSAPAISKHLRVLENAGLIVREKQGRVTYCHLTERALEAATRWLHEHRRFWEQQIDALSAFLKQDSPRWTSSARRRRTSSSGSNVFSTPRVSASSTRGRRPKR
jgi:DNA-binding transcriptional ArsR family regulator